MNGSTGALVVAARLVNSAPSNVRYLNYEKAKRRDQVSEVAQLKNSSIEVLKATPEVGAFVAGTPVHTKRGLVPIEKLRVGDLVLARSANGTAELAYKPVVNTFVHQDQQVCLVEYFLSHEMTMRSLVVTGNHPFWVRGLGWTSADLLEPNHILEVHDGAEAGVFKVRRIFRTETPDVGWTTDDSGDTVPTIDMREGLVEVSEAFVGDTTNHYALDAQEYLTRRVFNIEVGGFHTYYVGESGVWVHDINLAEPLATT